MMGEVLLSAISTEVCHNIYKKNKKTKQKQTQDHGEKLKDSEVKG